MISVVCRSGLFTHVRDLARELNRRGWDVRLAFQQTREFIEENPGPLLATMAPVPYDYFSTRRELEALVEEHRPHLLHAHSFLGFFPTCQVSRARKVPFVVTLHSVFRWSRYFRDVLREAQGIIAVGPAQASSASPFKVSIIENGIDLTDYPAPAALEVPERIEILWYGRVDGKLVKGLRALDGSAPFLPTNVSLRALGSPGWPLKNIPLLGWQDRPVDVLRRSHMVFAHSRSLREAMACGNIGMLLGYGYGGRVTEEKIKSGLILDAFPQYPLQRPVISRLVREIRELTQDPTRIPPLQREARRIAEEYFSLKVMVDRTIALYQGSGQGD
jgi:glycosyltransferase involved in cell wall biosynthesis